MSKRPEKNQLPLELQHCEMEIYRKEQSLTPLFNQIRNQVIDQFNAYLPGLEEIEKIINDNCRKIIDKDKVMLVYGNLAQIIHDRIWK